MRTVRELTRPVGERRVAPPGDTALAVGQVRADRAVSDSSSCSRGHIESEVPLL